MLRVRPVHFTSRPEKWEELLAALGLAKTVDQGPWREFDAGSGRLALHVTEPGSHDDGATSFGVEVGDLAEFARRTGLSAEESGTTAAELITAGPRRILPHHRPGWLHVPGGPGRPGSEQRRALIPQ